MSRSFTGLALLAGALATPVGAQDLYLTGANIVDPAKREVRQANLLVLDGRIVGEPAAPPSDFEGTTISTPTPTATWRPATPSTRQVPRASRSACSRRE